MKLGKVFDTVPKQFDRYRPRYSAELFASLSEDGNKVVFKDTFILCIAKKP